MLLDSNLLAARLEALEASVQQLEVLWTTGQFEPLSHAVLPATWTVLQSARKRLCREGWHCADKQATSPSSICDHKLKVPSETGTLQRQPNRIGGDSHSRVAHELLRYSAAVLHSMLQDCPFNLSGAAWAATDFLQLNSNITDVVLCGRIALHLPLSAEEACKVLREAYVLPPMRGALDFINWYKEHLRPQQITCGDKSTVQAHSNQADAATVKKKPIVRRLFASKIVPAPVHDPVTLKRDSLRGSAPNQPQPKLAVKTYLQWEGRVALQWCWWTLLVLRGAYDTIPAQLHQQLFTSPFLKCFTNALDAALAHPTRWLLAFVPEISSDVRQRAFTRLYRHNGQVINSNPHLVGKRMSISRIISCIHADGVAFFSVLHRLMSQVGCSSERSCADDAHSLDAEATKRASRVHELIHETVSGAMERALTESRNSAVWTRRVEVDVWPCEPPQPLSVQRLFSSSDSRLFGRPRELLCTHHQAIMVLADFIDRMICMPKFVQRLLLPVCIHETRHFVDILQNVAQQHSNTYDSRPLMAVSALLCLRRRIRSMLLSHQVMQMIWRAGGDQYGHLSQTAHMLMFLDRSIDTTEELLIRRFADVIEETVVRAYRDVSWTQMHWAAPVMLPSAPLRHLRCVLHALMHRLAQTVSVAMAESVLLGVTVSAAKRLIEVLIAKPFTLAWSQQKVHDAHHLCTTMWWLSQPHVALDQHADLDEQQEFCIGNSLVGGLCWRMAHQVTLQTCSATEFTSMAVSPSFWDIDANALAAENDQKFQQPCGWDWFREQRVQTLDLLALVPAFCPQQGNDAFGDVDTEWPRLSKKAMDVTRPLDLLEALPARPELQQKRMQPAHMADSVQVIRHLCSTWPAFSATSRFQEVQQFLEIDV